MKACDDSQELYNFFRPYFCWLQEDNWFAVPLIILLLVIILKFICETVEDYVAPAIVYLTEYLNMSDSLAGVTLLAFANGAGDVLTAIVASDSKEGVSYNVGALYGAGLFVLTLVVGMTIRNSSKKIIVEKSLIFRDIGFYILATIITIGFGIYGEITIFTSILFLTLYIVLVLIVLIQDYLAAKEKEEKTETPVDEPPKELEE